MPLLEIPISEELEKEISSIAKDKQSFILQALKEKLGQVKLNRLREQLIEGYKTNENEVNLIAKDFEILDSENWHEY